RAAGQGHQGPREQRQGRARGRAGAQRARHVPARTAAAQERLVRRLADRDRTRAAGAAGAAGRRARARGARRCPARRGAGGVTRRGQALCGIAIATILVALASCGSSSRVAHTSSAASTPTSTLPGTGRPTVTIGDKNFTEQFVLGELYFEALKAQGFAVQI